MDTQDQLIITSDPTHERSYTSECHVRLLPVELLLLVFGHLNSSIKDRLILSHVSRDWRAIALQNAALWTDIRIFLGQNTDKDSFNNFMSLLSMQLSRTADLLLDVYWFSIGNEHRNDRIMYLIHEMAPYSRWRTLAVRGDGMRCTIPPSHTPQDEFINLESLTVFTSLDSWMIHMITRSATSKLRELDLYYMGDSAAKMSASYSGLFERISSLVIPMHHTDIVNITLPPNIVKLEARTRRKHDFPYITTYIMADCGFTVTQKVHLPNLTTLIVTSSLDILANCEVTLSSLLSLQCAFIRLEEGAVFSAPALKDLQLRASESETVNLDRVSTLNQSLRHPGLQISPKVSIISDLCLWKDSIHALFEISPHVEKVHLSFNEYTGAAETLQGLFGPFKTAEGQIVEGSVGMSLKMVELRLNFSWIAEDVDFWRSWAASVRLERKATGLPVFSIYGLWKRQCEYVPLV